MAGPEIASTELTGDQTLADLRLLAEGFRVVSAAAANVATNADTQPLRSRPSEGDGPSGPAPETSPARAAADTAPLAPVLLPVSPPVAISQRLPPWRETGSFNRGDFSGAIDFVIDEQGHVESVSLRKSVHPLYDRQLLEAAKTWTYEPARRGGQPIKFQKTLVVRVNSR